MKKLALVIAMFAFVGTTTVSVAAVSTKPVIEKEEGGKKDKKKKKKKCKAKTKCCAEKSACSKDGAKKSCTKESAE